MECAIGVQGPFEEGMMCEGGRKEQGERAIGVSGVQGGEVGARSVMWGHRERGGCANRGDRKSVV